MSDAISPAVVLPDLVLRVISRAGLANTIANMNNNTLCVLAASLIKCGYDCDLVTRSAEMILLPSWDGSGDTYIHLKAIKINNHVFNLQGSEGWDQIAKDHMVLFDYKYSHSVWIGGEERAFKNLFFVHTDDLMDIIREEMAADARKVLCDEIDGQTFGKMTDQKRKI